MSGRGTVAIVALAAVAACHKTDGTAVPAPPRATPLPMLPADTLLVISVDLARLRNAPLVAKLAAAAPLPAAFAQVVDGVDPWRTFDSVVLAEGVHGRWALLARGQHLDEARLVAGVRRALPGTEAFLMDERTLVVAAAAWAREMTALARGGGTAANSAAANADLASLCQGVSEHPVWGAAMVSAQLRDEWLDNLQMQEAAYLDRLTVSLDIDTGLEGKLTAMMTEPAQADSLAEDLAQRLVRERLGSESTSMLEGLLKGITTYADGNAVHVDASLGEAQLVSGARWLSRYWRIVGAKLPEASKRAIPLKLVAGAGSAGSGPITLGDARIFSDWDNNRYAIIEVANRTSRPVAPALQLVYRRQSGDMVAPGLCIVPVGILLAREKTVCVAQAPAGAVSANYDVRVLGDAEVHQTRIPLKLLGARLGPPLGPMQWVAGRVRNDSHSVLEHPQVHVSFYDAGGKLVGYGREDFEDKPLLPGNEAPFQATSTVVMPSAAKSFTVTAFGLSDKQ